MGLKAQKKKCWALFSKYIRLRDSIKTTGTRTHLRCITCNQIVPIERAQAGHFIAGRNNAILFDEKCVHGQCVRCNMFLHGRPLDYAIYMIRTYGQEEIDRLMAKRNTTVKFDLDELEAFEEWLKEKIKEMEK